MFGTNGKGGGNEERAANFQMAELDPKLIPLAERFLHGASPNAAAEVVFTSSVGSFSQSNMTSTFVQVGAALHRGEGSIFLQTSASEVLALQVGNMFYSDGPSTSAV